MKFLFTACLLVAGLSLSCSRGAGGREEPLPGLVTGMTDPEPVVAATDPASPGGAPTEEDPTGRPGPHTQASGTLGTGVLVCDKYIRMVCGCAQKRQSPALQRSCDLARLSLPAWKKNHNGEDEELTVVKACQRAFLYIQSTGQCDDVSY